MPLKQAIKSGPINGAQREPIHSQPTKHGPTRENPAKPAPAAAKPRPQ